MLSLNRLFLLRLCLIVELVDLNDRLLDRAFDLIRCETTLLEWTLATLVSDVCLINDLPRLPVRLQFNRGLAWHMAQFLPLISQTLSRWTSVHATIVCGFWRFLGRMRDWEGILVSSQI